MSCCRFHGIKRLEIRQLRGVKLVRLSMVDSMRAAPSRPARLVPQQVEGEGSQCGFLRMPVSSLLGYSKLAHGRVGIPHCSHHIVRQS